MSTVYTFTIEQITDKIKSENLSGPDDRIKAAALLGEEMIYNSIPEKTGFQLKTHDEVKADISVLPQNLRDDETFMENAVNSSDAHDGFVFKDGIFIGVLLIKIRNIFRPAVWLTEPEYSLMVNCRDNFNIQFLLAAGEQKTPLECEFTDFLINLAQEKYSDLGKQTRYTQFRIDYQMLLAKIEEEKQNP